jgi:ABC-type amino acid transport substrate-binding protein
MNKLRIGVVRDDIGDQLITALGVDDDSIERTNSAVNMIQMLDRNRLDAIAYAEDVAHYQFGIAGLDNDDFETVRVLKRSHMGYSFHRTTDPRILEPIRQALDELRADGTIDRIYRDYIRGAKSAER